MKKLIDVETNRLWKEFSTDIGTGHMEEIRAALRRVAEQAVAACKIEDKEMTLRSINNGYVAIKQSQAQGRRWLKENF